MLKKIILISVFFVCLLTNVSAKNIKPPFEKEEILTLIGKNIYSEEIQDIYSYLKTDKKLKRVDGLWYSEKYGFELSFDSKSGTVNKILIYGIYQKSKKIRFTGYLPYNITTNMSVKKLDSIFGEPEKVNTYGTFTYNKEYMGNNYELNLRVDLNKEILNYISIKEIKEKPTLNNSITNKNKDSFRSILGSSINNKKYSLDNFPFLEILNKDLNNNLVKELFKLLGDPDQLSSIDKSYDIKSKTKSYSWYKKGLKIKILNKRKKIASINFYNNFFNYKKYENKLPFNLKFNLTDKEIKEKSKAKYIQKNKYPEIKRFILENITILSIRGKSNDIKSFNFTYTKELNRKINSINFKHSKEKKVKLKVNNQTSSSCLFYKDIIKASKDNFRIFRGKYNNKGFLGYWEPKILPYKIVSDLKVFEKSMNLQIYQGKNKSKAINLYKEQERKVINCLRVNGYNYKIIKSDKKDKKYSDFLLKDNYINDLMIRVIYSLYPNYRNINGRMLKTIDSTTYVYFYKTKK